ncbi:hypothetical protein [Natronolimnohabitans innermongolicus]|uniref:Uncharacterized protein n=1 Tax=Natronolimnohabitans innermongolicus JCM 12255 TaxID=1227499 RepID=L9WHV2_9EURY|nr:hypothetical protein [Natronolimnohabitans innermongolicus]ELY48942.1 hypothetical protein C493_21136 [Natronolimnohabitans innermongolicus JCM 12255]
MPDSSERGPVDWNALQTVERIFRDRLDGLVAETTYDPNAIDPVELRITLAVGFENGRSRFDIQWWTNHGYKYHYSESESDLEFRFGWETRPRTTYPEKHFHPPTNTTEHRESCIRHEVPELVTLAVIKCWWTALEAEDPSLLNDLDEPP